MSNEIEALSRGLADAVASAGPAVVRVEGRRRRAASGFVATSDGLIVAASHAVERDEDIRISFDGDSTVSAELIGRDPATDVALLRAEAAVPNPPSWTDAPIPRVGNLVLGLGRPGRTVRASFGIVGASAEGWRNPAGARLDRYLELDGLLPSGFSGGPIIDVSGRLVGLGTTGLVSGAGMVVPVENLRRIIDTLKAHGGIRRGYLGIGSHPVRLTGRARDIAQSDVGLIILTVEPGGPAEKAGILLGDVLLSIDSVKTGSLEALLGTLSEDNVGRTVAAQLLRAGALHNLSITIGERR
ncbi:MAG: trypsin-like peptidase domain-containing protein [Myxococcaceae bacterium]|nr:trypsin-like peptidase domain-containing protein [Myxococcaceae bacterium]